MADDGVRLFSRDFKLAVLARMAAGENVSAVARELGVRRSTCTNGASGFGRVARLRCGRADDRAMRKSWRCRRVIDHRPLSRLRRYLLRRRRMI